jgi:DNA-binding CsgD family transcriptional regulator
MSRRVAGSGAELVGLAEHFYARAFAGTLAIVGFAATAALALLPLRDSAADVGLTTPTVLLTAALAVAAPVLAFRAAPLYRRMRGKVRAELVLVAMAAALIAYPLRSELWWPACALLMLLGVIAPLRRTLVYCGCVLTANLAAHGLAGDLPETPAVAILGLWIGLGFWATTAVIFTDRIGAYLMRLDVAQTPEAVQPAGDDDPVDEHVAPALLPDRLPTMGGERLQRLTARQLEVVALLADGLRYAEIAVCLSISARQVQRHVAEAVARLGLRNANELVAVAVASGLVPPR